MAQLRLAMRDFHFKNSQCMHAVKFKQTMNEFSLYQKDIQVTVKQNRMNSIQTIRTIYTPHEYFKS